MKRFFLEIQTTSDWPQIWCGGWNWDLIEAYQISAKLETKNFLRFGLVCFGHKSEDERPPLNEFVLWLLNNTSVFQDCPTILCVRMQLFLRHLLAIQENEG